jgi:diguanylate cyclase (GGDEF)-like protein/PAS domain S-box-containing protein
MTPLAAGDPEAGGRDGNGPVAIGSPEMFRAIVESSVSPFVVVGSHGRVVWAGPQVEHLLGEPPETFVGRHMLDTIAPESHEAAVAAFTSFTAGEGHPGPWIGPPMLLELLTRDGSRVTCEISAARGRAFGIDGVILQVRRWRGTVLLYGAVDALAGGAPLPEVLARLIDLVEHDSPGSVASVVTGWDGARWSTVVHSPALGEAADVLLGDPAELQRAVERDLVTGVDGIGPSIAAACRERGLDECWLLPVRIRDERVPSAALLVWRSVPGTPQPHLVTTIERVGRLVGLAIESHQNRTSWRRAALTDELTGLGSRSALEEHLAELDRTGSARSVLFCDLDGFKEVNDELGHEVGDRVLQVVADRLRGALRPDDVAIRWGGDEFAIICTGHLDPEALATRIIDRVNEPIVVGPHTLQLGISIGVAWSSGPTPVADLLRRGDHALRDAKIGGKNRFLVAAQLT